MDFRLWSDRKDAAAKLASGFVIVTTVIMVAIGVYSLLTSDPGSNSRQEVRSARAPEPVASPGTASLPTATPTPSQEPTSLRPVPVPAVPTLGTSHASEGAPYQPFLGPTDGTQESSAEN